MGSERHGEQDSFPKDKRYNFQILGQEIILKTDKEENYINSLINFIEKKAESITGVSFIRKNLLLLLDITDELFMEREKRKKIERDLEKKLDFLSSLVPE